ALFGGTARARMGAADGSASPGESTMRRTILAGAVLVLAVAVAPAGRAGAAAGAAAAGRGAAAGPGPALATDPVALDTALACPDGLHHPGRAVVLLVHGTATTATETWPSGLGRVLPAAGFDWCTVQLPGRALVDIQDSAEYVVAAVRRLRAA